ncbi:uncharacterized protein LOC111640267 [Centruroides sculpturatus]|uniref:uncharacterized protein LOC111640267 n=1 Tax=Centruroides sculpturatus TaxID=218467 RepID=UPI000C6E3B40|nr:uncharacterized protein LOC111640267 [Centruroides sculpturatus]
MVLSSEDLSILLQVTFFFIFNSYSIKNNVWMMILLGSFNLSTMIMIKFVVLSAAEEAAIVHLLVTNIFVVVSLMICKLMKVAKTVIISNERWYDPENVTLVFVQTAFFHTFVNWIDRRMWTDSLDYSFRSALYFYRRRTLK